MQFCVLPEMYRAYIKDKHVFSIIRQLQIVVLAFSLLRRRMQFQMRSYWMDHINLGLR